MLKDIVSRFLLASLSIDAILRETTMDRRRQKLRAMKNGLDLEAVYGATLERIKAQGGEKARLGMAVLMWISHSWRPLQVDEICHTIATQIGWNGLDSDDIPPISTLLGFCQGLIIIDKDTSTVKLIHFTLQEYLCTHPNIFDKAHSTMAETCLTYLNFQHIKDLSADPSPDPRSTPFLEYSSLYWGTHMRMELSDRAKVSALQLLDRFDSHAAANVLWNSISPEFTVDPTLDRKPFSALHCISYFGIAEVTNILIKKNIWDVNETDSAGMTPLIWATRYGHEEVVRLLLQEKHIQPDQQGTNDGRTALSWAAGNGHEGAVKLFFEPQFVNPGSIGHLWKRGPRVAGRLFRRRYVNPDSSSKSSRTPLSWAAENGHEGIVKLLLEREGVNPDIPDTEYGQTPLLWAARNGHEETVKLLLERKNVNPNSSSKLGQTPLLLAAMNGHERVVKLLLEREDVDPNTLDTEYGQTPLSWAARNGHEETVKPLLEREDVNPNSSSKLGQTPLLLAAMNSHERVVKLLLEREDVNPNTPDTEYGQTPLSWAAQNGCEGIVELLLGREDASPNSSSKSGQTPLALAAQNGHDRVVNLLRARHSRLVR